MSRIILIIYLSIIFFITSNFSCSKKAENIEIQFGWGGGFAGIEHIYTLNARGEIIKEGKTVATLTKKEMKKIYKLYKNLPQKDFNHPYNTYKFLIIKENDIHKKYTWGEPGFKPNESVVEIYKILKNHLKQ